MERRPTGLCASHGRTSCPRANHTLLGTGLRRGDNSGGRGRPPHTRMSGSQGPLTYKEKTSTREDGIDLRRKMSGPQGSPTYQTLSGLNASLRRMEGIIHPWAPDRRITQSVILVRGDRESSRHNLLRHIHFTGAIRLDFGGGFPYYLTP
jgi:hypothetical protein